MAYNLTPLENLSSMGEFVTGINQVVDGLYFAVILAMFFVIYFVASKHQDTVTSLRTTAFFTSIIAVLFRIFGVLDDKFMIIPIVILGLTLFFDWLTKE